MTSYIWTCIRTASDKGYKDDADLAIQELASLIGKSGNLEDRLKRAVEVVRQLETIEEEYMNKLETLCPICHGSVRRSKGYLVGVKHAPDCLLAAVIAENKGL